MIPRLLTLQDALIAYDLRKSEIEGLTQEDLITTGRVSVVYKRENIHDTQSLFTPTKDILTDLEEVEKASNISLPLHRINNELIRSFDVVIAGQRHKIIPADITLLYFAEIYQALSEAKHAVPQVINFQGTVAQLVPTHFTQWITSGSKYTAPLRYRNVSLGRVAQDNNQGFALLEDFRGFLRNNFEHGDNKTKTKPSRANMTNVEIQGIDTPTLQHYMNILEANRQRIIREKTIQEKTSNGTVVFYTTTTLLAYDVVFQQLELIISLMRRGLLQNGTRYDLVNVHKVFIYYIDPQNYFIRRPMSVYLNKMSDIVNYWQAFLQEPIRLYQYQAYYNDAINKTLTKLDIDIQFMGSDNPKDNYYHVRYNQDLLVPNPEAIYDKHPQDIDNVTVKDDPYKDWTGLSLTYYTIPVRERLERNKRWNLRLLSGESKHILDITPWDRTGRVSSQQANSFSYPSIKQAYEKVRATLPQPITYSSEPYNYTNEKDYNGSVLFPYPIESFRRNVLLGFVKEKGLKKLTISLTLNTVPKTYTSRVEEPPLELPKLRHKYIKINGISFNSLDLVLLYNTFLLETLVATQEPEVTLPLMPLKDLKLLKDVFTGHTSLNYAYTHFSEYTYRQLSGGRTMLNIYELIIARRAIDRFFDLGLPLRIQLASIKLSYPLAPRSFSQGLEQEISISRLEELINLSGKLLPNEPWVIGYIF